MGDTSGEAAVGQGKDAQVSIMEQCAGLAHELGVTFSMADTLPYVIPSAIFFFK